MLIFCVSAFFLLIIALMLSDAVMISHLLPLKWQCLIFSSWETDQILKRGRNSRLYLLKLLLFGYLKILLFHQI